MVKSDYDLLRTEVAAVDRSERGKLILFGRDAAEFLQGQLTNDIEALEPGHGCYAALLTHKGKMQTDVRVLRGSDWIRLDTEPVGLAPLARTVRTYSIGRDVSYEDRTAQEGIVSLIGPKAFDLLDQSPPTTEHSFVEAAHGLYVATDLGVDIICPADEAAQLAATLGVEQVAESAAEVLRLEAGRPRYGLDIDESTIPQEAGINERAVSFTKGCYVGQETVARLHYKGKPNRHLFGLRLSHPAHHGDEVWLDGSRIGAIGSSASSPREGPIALAILRRQASAGATVTVGADGQQAEIVELPFAD